MKMSLTAIIFRQCDYKYGFHCDNCVVGGVLCYLYFIQKQALFWKTLWNILIIHYIM